MNLIRTILRAGSTFLLAVALPVAAQNVSSTLNGTVRGSSGAVVPGATVTLTNEQTYAIRTAQTNTEGYFVLADLLPGVVDESEGREAP